MATPIAEQAGVQLVSRPSTPGQSRCRWWQHCALK